MTEQRNIAHKIAEIMGEITTIEKRGQFTVGTTVRYKYVQAADLYDHVRAKLADRHVAFIASVVDIVAERETPTQNSGKMYTTTVRVRLSLHDADTGESIVADWLGVGQDSGDKGIPKAFTGAVKSWLMTTFLVPSDTDPDDQGGQKAKRQSAGKLAAKDAETLVKLLNAYLDTGLPEAKTERATVLRLRLRQLGAGQVDNVVMAAKALSKDKATQLFEWLDAEVVEAQKAAKA